MRGKQQCNGTKLALVSDYDSSKTLLSIIIPCYNIEGKSNDLMETLYWLEEDIEIVFVDDGSTDDTSRILSNFIETNPSCLTKLIKQPNRGAGGARNTGIAASTGRFVWTVDADDDFDPIAIKELRKHVITNAEFDFIDFNMANEKHRNTMNLEKGTYIINKENGLRLLEHFGRITTKIFSRKFIERSSFSYPESVKSEDSCLTFFLPYFTKSFIKSTTNVYFYNKNRSSRLERGCNERQKVLACVWARANCLAKAVDLYRSTPVGLAVFSSRIRDTLLKNPLQTLIGFRRPSSILDAAKCFRFYRDVMSDLGFTVEQPKLDSLTSKQLVLARLAFLLSFFYPRQHGFFKRLYASLQPEFDGLDRRRMWEHLEWNK